MLCAIEGSGIIKLVTEGYMKRTSLIASISALALGIAVIASPVMAGGGGGTGGVGGVGGGGVGGGSQR